MDRLTRGRCPACNAFLSRTGRERPYRRDGRIERYDERNAKLPPTTTNPLCVRCRSEMRRSGYKHGRPYFRCTGCRARAIASGPRRFSKPPQHLGCCADCRRGLVINGNRCQYLFCPRCKVLTAREGVKAPRTARAHLASCVECRRPMHNHMQHRDGSRYYYCRHCGWAAYAHCTRAPGVPEQRLLAFVESYVPRDMHREIREEVVADILLALLKPRRAKNGYGLSTGKMSPEVVRKFIRAAWRRRDHEFKQISIHEGEWPLIERLVG